MDPQNTKSRNQRLLIHDGMVHERLTIGEIVRNVRDHILFVETPSSYLAQGRLRECTCSCGVTKLISESILSTGRVKSCGCLRKEYRDFRSKEGLQNAKDKADRKYILAQIKIEQRLLKQLQVVDILLRDDKVIGECAGRIRNLYRAKALLKRKHTKLAE